MGLVGPRHLAVFAGLPSLIASRWSRRTAVFEVVGGLHPSVRRELVLESARAPSAISSPSARAA